MAHPKTQQRSFGGGEISPEMFGRFDDLKYQTGLAKCRNFIVKPQGLVENRPGFMFVREVKDSTKKTRLIPFTYSTTQTMVIELGAGYFRFHTQGATLLDGSAPYEVANPYAEADLFDIHYVQSADVLTLVHPNYAPRELRRLGPTNWVLSTVLFTAGISSPGAPTLVAAGHTAVKYTYYYVVTAVAADGISESAASAASSVGGNLYETGATVTISWTAVSGAGRYNVYKRVGGLYGYIGQTSGTSIVDDDIDPDMGKTPPIYENPFQKDSSIVSVPVTEGGTGYSFGQTGGAFTSISMDRVMVISFAPTLEVSDPTGSGAVFAVNMSEAFGQVESISIVSPGSGYTNPVFTLKREDGVVVSTVSTSNFKYTLTPVVQLGPSISVSDTTGSGAVLKPVVTGGVLTSVSVIYGGSGYTNPTLTVTSNNGGSGAVLGTPVIDGSTDYPSAVSYFEQRRVFSGTRNKPQHIWMTRSGTESDMSYSLPIRDDDRISFRVAAREANSIRHIVPLTQLLLLTSAAEWRVTSMNNDAITPTSVSVKPQSYIGASNVQPVIVNNSLLYVAARGGHIRELGYNWQANGFVTGDLSLRAAHLFDSRDIVDMCYVKSPNPIAWFVSSAGNLIGLTYVPEQQIGAWHPHDTDGKFLSCCAVAEGDEDVLYCVISRTINGQHRQYIERLASRQFVEQADAFFVDCGATYSGEPTDTLSGLAHLEGCIVNILADGAVHPQRTVVGGSIALDIEARKIHIGLPYESDLQTLPVAMMLRDGSYGQGHMKNVNKVWMRVYRSSGIFVGPDETRLTEVKQRKTEPYGSPPALKSEEVPVTLTPSWGDSGQIFVRQYDPLPLSVIGITAEIAGGG